jgi:hypothetical protein
MPCLCCGIETGHALSVQFVVCGVRGLWIVDKNKKRIPSEMLRYPLEIMQIFEKMLG